MNAFDAFLLDTCLPLMQNIIDESTVTWNRLKKSPLGIKGDYIISKTKIKRNQGFGGALRGGALPAARDPDYLDAKLDLRSYYGTMRLYGQDKILSANAKKTEAFQSILATNTEDEAEGMGREMNRIIWGDGSGELGRVNGAQNGVNTINVVDARWFELNQLIDIHESSVIEDRYLTDVDKENNTITISGATVNVTDNTLITRANSKDTEPMGFKSFLLPTTSPSNWGEYANINRDTYKDWRSVYLHNSGTLRDLDLDMLDELVLKAIRNGAKNLSMYMTLDIYRAILKLRKAKSVPTEYTTINLGYRVPTYESSVGMIPMILEEDSFKNAVTLVEDNDTIFRTPDGVQWLPGNGGTILRIIEGYDYEQANIRIYANTLNVNPKHSGVLADVRFPTA